MRTKQYLAALCLPLAFAACSDEEYVTDSPLLGSRGTINVTLNATKPGFDDVNTRMGIDDAGKFVWEKDVDMIGAAMVDEGTLGTIDDKVRVNYPFTAQSSAAVSAFNSKSAISAGNYLFYYSYKDHLAKAEMDFSVPEQTYDVALAGLAKNAKDAKQQAVGYMRMISPIVNLAGGVKYEDAQSYNLNLSFVNLYTMVKVIVSSKNIKEGTTPKLKKVTLNAAGGASNGFVKTAKANMKKIANAGSSPSYIVTPDAETKQILADKMEAATAAIEELVSEATNSNVSSIYISATKGAAELNIEGDLALSETEATEVYILAPKGKYNSGLTLTVETTEGVYTKDIKKGSTDLILGDQIQQMGADLDFSKDVKAPMEFSIGSTADWNNAIEFIDSHLKSYVGNLPTFTLTKDVTIAALPDYAVKVVADAAKTLTFSEDFTLAKGGKMLDANSGDNVTLCVASGATLTLNDASEFAIQNNGTLNVNADQSEAITNLGTMNVGAAVNLTGGLNNGKEAVVGPSAAAAIEGTINILKGNGLTIGTAALDNKVGTITVDGTLTISQASTNGDKIIVGKTGTLTGSTAITNEGTIENSGTLTISTAMVNDNGTFVIKDGSKGGNSSGPINKGTVMVETGATLPTSGEAYGFGSGANAPVISTEVTTNEEYSTANDVDVITNIILSKQQEWKIGGGSNLAVPANNVKSLTLKGVKLTVGAGISGLKSIIVEDGASTITAAAALSITGSVGLTVEQGAALTVENNITFNEAKTDIAATAKATILGTLKVEAGAKLYFATAEVGATGVTGAKLTVAGNISTGSSVAAGVFGVYLNSDASKFKNWGTISSLTGETEGADNAGQITGAQAQSGEAIAQGLGTNANVEFQS